LAACFVLLFNTQHGQFTMQVHQNSWNMQQKEGLSPCEKTQLHADKWRHDRNFWISSLILVLWVVLHCFYHQADSYMRLTAQLEEAGIEPDVKNSAAYSAATDAAAGAHQSIADAAAGVQQTAMDAKDSMMSAMPGTKKQA
jgi:hypothetical protein